MKEYVHPTKHEIEIALERIELYKELFSIPKPEEDSDRDHNEYCVGLQERIDILADAICAAVVEFKTAPIGKK